MTLGICLLCLGSFLIGVVYGQHKLLEDVNEDLQKIHRLALELKNELRKVD